MSAVRRAASTLAAALLAALGSGVLASPAPAQEGVDPGNPGGVAGEPVRLLIAGREAVLDPARFEGTVGPVHAVVALSRIPVGPDLESLEALGVRLHQYLPHLAYNATVPAERAAELLALPFVLGAEPFRPEWKARPSLAERPDLHLWRTGEGRALAAIYFFPDVDPARARAVLEEAGAEIVSETPEINGRILARLDPARVPELLARDEIRWMETGRLPRRLRNESAAEFHSVDAVLVDPFGLDGTGVRVGVMDGDVVQDDHPDFGNRVTVAQTYGYPADFHATHVTGTILGDGSTKAAARGMAPGARSWNWSFYVYDTAGTKRTGFGQNDLDVDNNSWGNAVGWEFFNGTWWWFANTEEFGAYLSLVGDLDAVAADTDVLVSFAAGNDGWDDGYDGYGFIYYYYYGHLDYFPSTGNYYIHYGFHGLDGDGTGFANVGAYASMKNGLGVGAVYDDGTLGTFSSRGPAADGRLKPDVVAVGVDVLSTVPVDKHAESLGTSMATPVVTGIAALVVQAWNEAHGSADPRLDVLKGLLLHSTFDLGPAGPDYRFGFGGIDAGYAAALALDDDGTNPPLHRTGSISQGGTREYLVQAGASLPVLRATLCWTDPPGNPSASKALVNDLDLTLVSPTGSTHLPWRLNPSSPSSAATRGVNSLDNVEMAEVASPVAGTWKVVVRGTTVPQGPQPFAVWFSQPYLNLAPTAAAGGDRDVPAALPTGRTLALSSALSTDPNGSDDIVLVEWDVDGDGSFTDPGGSLVGPSVTHHFPIGERTVTLRVTDRFGLSATDAFLVTVRNNPPVASLGPDRVLRATDPEGTTLVLDCSLCSDPQTAADIASVRWDYDDDGEFDDAVGSVQEIRLGLGVRRIGVRILDQGGLASSAYASFTVIGAENVLARGGKFKGSLGDADDTDTFFFEGAPGDALTLSFKGKSHARVRVFAPSGAAVLDRVPGGGEFRFREKGILLSETGWHWLEVAPFGPSDAGPYSLSLKIAPAPVRGVHRDVLDGFPPVHVRPLTLLEGTRLAAKAKGKKGIGEFVGNPILVLRGPDGEDLGAAGNGGTVKLAAAAKTGIYELRVAPLGDAAGHGGYELTWKGKAPRGKTKILEAE